jgi:exosortase
MGNSVQVAPLVTEQRGPETRGPERQGPTPPIPPWWQGGVLLALMAWLYGPILWRLARQWLSDQNFSHGIFVPAFALFILWQKRKEISEIVAAPSWTGVPILIGGLVMLVLGVLGAELFFSRTSLLLLIAGLVILLWGWPVFRAVLFPWAFLILMIPIPAILFQKITFPLQILASKIAAALLPVAGVPVLREGNVITLPSMPLEVAEACSGIRSLLTLVTLAIIYGYLLDKRKWMRVLLAVSAVPIAVFANSLRIVFTGLVVQYWDPEKGKGFYHEFSGWIIFVVALLMLFSVHTLAGRWRRQTKAA